MLKAFSKHDTGRKTKRNYIPYVYKYICRMPHIRKFRTDTKKEKKPMTGIETTTNNTLRTGRF